MQHTAEHYRAPMRSRDDAVPRHAGVERALTGGVCGIGGRLPRVPHDLQEALVEVERRHGERAARRLRLFAAVAEGMFVWTRDAEGRFHRGALTGPWTYDDAMEAAEADLVHVRACLWTPRQDVQVPDEVLASFARGGRNFQRIRAL